MTTVARRDPADKAKIDAIEKKLLANPEIAKLIDNLGTSTTDANDLVRGMLQASITRGLNAEMDAHLGYESGDRSAKAAAGTDNYRNGSYPKTVDSNYAMFCYLATGLIPACLSACARLPRRHTY